MCFTLRLHMSAAPPQGGLTQALDLRERLMQLTNIEAVAIERFTLNVTVPILYDSGDSGQLLATGTLFKVENRSFIITARHIFDDLPDPTRLAYPENPTRGGLFTLGSFNRLFVKDSGSNQSVPA